jgi:hypothetical protein
LRTTDLYALAVVAPEVQAGGVMVRADRVSAKFLILCNALIMGFAPVASAEESPRMKCLQKAQNNHFACLANAGNDQAKKSACTKKLSEELAACPAP